MTNNQFSVFLEQRAVTISHILSIKVPAIRWLWVTEMQNDMHSCDAQGNYGQKKKETITYPPNNKIKCNVKLLGLINTWICIGSWYHAAKFVNWLETRLLWNGALKCSGWQHCYLKGIFLRTSQTIKWLSLVSRQQKFFKLLFPHKTCPWNYSHCWVFLHIPVLQGAVMSQAAIFGNIFYKCLCG